MAVNIDKWFKDTAYVRLTPLNEYEQGLVFSFGISTRGGGLIVHALRYGFEVAWSSKLGGLK